MSRRLVVVLFLDLVGWTGLGERVDPEPLQLMLEQYYEVSSAAVEEHGGVVEKFIGDAVMAVFGADRSREDDAVRALRAAARIRAEVGALADPRGGDPRLRVHCGVAAGEALVTRSSRAGLRVVGDVVNVAARLQSAAAPDEILVNDVAADLAGQHWTLDRLAALTLKGKAEPVGALRVVGPAAPGRPGDRVPLVDRGAERAWLGAAYRRVAGDFRGRTVVVHGPPGIGKSRLVRAAIGEFRPGPLVACGACPSYAPPENTIALAEVLDALVRASRPARDLVRADTQAAAVLDDLRDAARGCRDGAGPGPGVEEVAWAARRIVAAAASAGPVVLVWDGLQWAGPSLLRLVGELAADTAHLPVLTICVARPEPAGDGPWVRVLPERDVLDVGALGPDDSAELAALLAAPLAEVQAHGLDLVERVARQSAGNPLFIRLMVESALPGRPAADVPPTITAMVGAMIDRLPAAARLLLGAASVIGSTFTAGQVAVLGEPVPGEAVEPLVAGGLVQATATAGEFRFVQQPVHEVAYARLDKQRRLGWHRLLAEAGVSPGFHWEAAVRLLGELRPGDADLVTLSGLAGRALLGEGTAALRRRDVPAAIGLLDRALPLVAHAAASPHPPERADGDAAVAVIRLSDALLLAGDTRRAAAVVADVLRGGPRAPGRRACLVQQHLLAARAGRPSAVPLADVRRELAGIAADPLARCRLAQLRMLLHLGLGRFAAAQRAAGVALAHARTLGDEYEQDRLLVALCELRQWSPTPLTEQLAGCVELSRRFAADRFLLVPVLAARARCLALMGDRAGARAALAQAGEMVEQLQLTMGAVLVDQAAGLACSLAGDHAAAERLFRRAAGVLERAEHGPPALTLRVQAARARACRDPDGARAEIAALLRRGSEMDVRGRLLCLSTAVRLAAGPRTGEVTALLARTDDPCLRGDVHADLARAYALRGAHAAARAMADAALACYAVVGATAPAEAVAACR